MPLFFLEASSEGKGKCRHEWEALEPLGSAPPRRAVHGRHGGHYGHEKCLGLRVEGPGRFPGHLDFYRVGAVFPAVVVQRDRPDGKSEPVFWGCRIY